MDIKTVYETKYSNDYGYLGGSKYSLNKQVLIDYVLSKGYKLSDNSKYYAKFKKGEFEYADIIGHDLLNLKEKSNEL